jgi:hypothetical protein
MAVIKQCTYSMAVINQCTDSMAVIKQCTYSMAVIKQCTLFTSRSLQSQVDSPTLPSTN